MRSKLHILRNLAVALVLAAFSLAPSAASAHAGHQHPPAAAAQQKQAEAPSIQQTVAPQTAIAVAEVTAARTVPPAPSGDAGCDGCACCASGACAGCHSAVLVSSLVPVPSLLSVMLAVSDAPSRANLHDGRLRRPPKSLV